MFSAILTLLAQLIAPCGYDDNTAGYAGGALLLAGLASFAALFILWRIYAFYVQIAAGIIGGILEKTHAYVPLLRIGIVISVSATIFMLASLRVGINCALKHTNLKFALCRITLMWYSLWRLRR